MTNVGLFVVHEIGFGHTQKLLTIFGECEERIYAYMDQTQETFGYIYILIFKINKIYYFNIK